MLAMFGGWLLAGGVLFLPMSLLDYAVPPLAAQGTLVMRPFTGVAFQHTHLRSCLILSILLTSLSEMTGIKNDAHSARRHFFPFSFSFDLHTLFCPFYVLHGQIGCRVQITAVIVHSQLLFSLPLLRIRAGNHSRFVHRQTSPLSSPRKDSHIRAGIPCCPGWRKNPSHPACSAAGKACHN